MDAILEFKLEDFVEHVFEKFAVVPRTFPAFPGVLREVIEDASQVDECTPVNVPEIHQ